MLKKYFLLSRNIDNLQYLETLIVELFVNLLNMAMIRNFTAILGFKIF